MTVYINETATVTKIKEKNRFRICSLRGFGATPGTLFSTTFVQILPNTHPPDSIYIAP